MAGASAWFLPICGYSVGARQIPPVSDSGICFMIATSSSALLSTESLRPWARGRRTFEGRTGRPPKYAEVRAGVPLSPQDALKRRAGKSTEMLSHKLERVEDEDVICGGTETGRGLLDLE